MIITLLTDFGDLDPYVGIMKGVIYGIAPEARLVDLTHRLALGNLMAANFVHYQAVPYFPPNTVHLTVVDPGVGSRRRPIAVHTDKGYFVGPDNGVFTFAYNLYNPRAIHELTNPAYRLPSISNTFHGRDIFSPAAAYLALGVPIDEFGPPVTDVVQLPMPRLGENGANQIAGEIYAGDRFGNLGTSIGLLRWEDAHTLRFVSWIPGRVRPRRFRADSAEVRVAGRTLKGIRRTFSDTPPGELAAIVGSEGHLDIVVNRGSAAEVTGLGAGDDVILVVD